MKNIFLVMLSMFNFAVGNQRTLEIPSYFGGNPLRVEIDGQGKVRVLSYPLQWDSSLSIIQFSNVGIFKDLSKDTCRIVESYAQKYQDPLYPPLAKERIREVLRMTNPAIIQLEVAHSFQSNQILAAVREQLNELGLSPTTLSLENPIEWQHIEFGLELSEKAISRWVGRIKQLDAMWGELFAETIRRTGSATGELAALDLLCDLAHGNAVITVRLRGNQLNSSKKRLLVPMASGKKLLEDLRHVHEPFYPGVERNEFGRNRIVATQIVLKSLGKQGIEVENSADLFLLVERLTEPRLGTPITFSDPELTDALMVMEKGDLSFEAHSTITLTVEGNPQ